LTTVSEPSTLIDTIWRGPARYTGICVNLGYNVPDPSSPIGITEIPYSCVYECDADNMYAACSNDFTCTNNTGNMTFYTNQCYPLNNNHWNYYSLQDNSTLARVCYVCEFNTVSTSTPTPTPTGVSTPITPTTGQPTISGQPINKNPTAQNNGNPTVPTTIPPSYAPYLNSTQIPPGFNYSDLPPGFNTTWIPTIVTEYKKSASGRLSTSSCIERIILLFLINSICC